VAVIKRDAGFWWALLLIAMVPMFGFIVDSGALSAYDRLISEALSLRGDAVSSLWAQILSGVTWLGHFGPRVCVSIILGLLVYEWRGWKAALAMLIVPILSSGYSSTMKSLFDIPRPQIIPHLDVVGSASYPSGHAAGAMVLYMMFAMAVPMPWRAWAAALAVVMISLMCWSRLALGVHWTSDIIGGLMGGLGFALLARPYLMTAVKRPD
jgi:undecaprenyl-diphosphatase